MGEQVQRRIAEEAVDRGYLDSARAAEILIEVGQRLITDNSVSPRLWVEQGWLSEEQLTEIVDDLPLEEGASSFDTFHGIEQVGEGFGRSNTQVEASSTDAWTEDPPQTDPDADSTEFERRPTVRDRERPAEVREAPSPTGHSSESGVDPEPDSESPDDEHVGRAGTNSDSASETLTPSEELPEKTTIDSSADELATPGTARDEQPRDDLADSTAGPLDASDDAADESNPGDGVDSGTETFRPEVAALEAASQRERLDPGDRYVLDDEIGRGGSGRVVRARDRVLDRRVAMKILDHDGDLDGDTITQFVAEARATGRLEHPNIVPIYDFGVLPDGDAFYTMREVRGDSLREVIQEIGEDGDEYTIVRLVNFLRQVSQAVHYAHEHSVVHRDLKPDNIMLGEFGEVLVMDWGLARILQDREDSSGAESDPDTVSSRHTLGTPSYMPPEQARGDLETVDETSDIYSLGATLYEILTLNPPYSGDGALEVMWDVVDGSLTSPSERAPEDRDIPEELEEICLKAMEPRREERHDSARDFHEDLEAWLEGLQPRQSQRLVRGGETASARYYELVEQIDEQQDRVRELSAEFEGWEPVDDKQELWDLEDELGRLEAESTRAFCEAVSKFTQALAKDPDNDDANRGLADLYWTQLRRAEMRGDTRDIIYYETLVEQYDPGNYAQRLESRTDLHVDTAPQGAGATLFEYEERNRQLVPTSPTDLGATPTEAESIPTGSYLVKIDPDDRRKIQQPVLLERDRDAEVSIRLPEPEDYEAGFRYIPAGEYLSGGDEEAFDPRPPNRIHVDSFFCSTYPVTFEDYLEWINELYDQEGDAALEHAPQTRGAEGLLVEWDDERDMWVPDPILIEGEARERYPEEEAQEWQLPVIGVRAADAEAYCAWRSERDGRNYRLPTPHEYEKAGRGVDGRRFPWGDSFDPTFCKMRFSRPENPPQPEPVGAFERDRSPYGVRDLAGGVQEWCSDEFEEGNRRTTKGGGWGQDARLCHLASTIDILDEARNARIGFRVVYDPEWA